MARFTHWNWAVADNDEVTQVKTNPKNHPQRRPSMDKFNYWYNEDGQAVLRWNPETLRSELRI